MNKIEINKNDMSNKELSKLLFIINAIEDGWQVRKSGKNYLFSKNKRNAKKVFSNEFLGKFMLKYIN